MRLSLVEHRASELSRGSLSDAAGEELFSRYGEAIDVEFPSPRTGYGWRLEPKGYVGVLKLSDGTTIELTPKTPVSNIVEMLGYAYDVRVRTLQGLVGVNTLEGVFDQLVGALATWTLDAGRQGLYQAYQAVHERKTTPRGRIDVARAMARPADLRLPCHFSDRTADVEANRVLLWTLDVSLRSALCSETVRRRAREAHRLLAGAVSLERWTGRECAALTYDRLSDRYRPAHGICALLLDCLGPDTSAGNRDSVPFLVNMPRLYERFFARWLAVHLPQDLSLRDQERVDVGHESTVSFAIDLALYDRATDAVLCVLDTKHKTPVTPLADDVHQVVSYATAKHCTRAALVYPEERSGMWRGTVGSVDVRAMTFGIGGDIAAAGQSFCRDLLTWCGSPGR